MSHRWVPYKPKKPSAHNRLRVRATATKKIHARMRSSIGFYMCLMRHKRKGTLDWVPKEVYARFV